MTWKLNRYIVESNPNGDSFVLLFLFCFVLSVHWESGCRATQQPCGNSSCHETDPGKFPAWWSHFPLNSAQGEELDTSQIQLDLFHKKKIPSWAPCIAKQNGNVWRNHLASWKRPMMESGRPARLVGAQCIEWFDCLLQAHLYCERSRLGYWHHDKFKANRRSPDWPKQLSQSTQAKSRNRMWGQHIWAPDRPRTLVPILLVHITVSFQHINTRVRLHYGVFVFHDGHSVALGGHRAQGYCERSGLGYWHPDKFKSNHRLCPIREEGQEIENHGYRRRNSKENGMEIQTVLTCQAFRWGIAGRPAALRLGHTLQGWFVASDGYVQVRCWKFYQPQRTEFVSSDPSVSIL